MNLPQTLTRVPSRTGFPLADSSTGGRQRQGWGGGGTNYFKMYFPNNTLQVKQGNITRWQRGDETVEELDGCMSHLYHLELCLCVGGWVIGGGAEGWQDGPTDTCNVRDLLSTYVGTIQTDGDGVSPSALTNRKGLPVHVPYPRPSGQMSPPTTEEIEHLEREGHDPWKGDGGGGHQHQGKWWWLEGKFVQTERNS